MKTFAKKIVACAILLSTAGWSAQSAADIALFESWINVDGTATTLDDSSVVPGVDGTAFDYVTGLGTISITLTGAGAHSVSLFVDHEMSETVNTFFNEEGAAMGTAAAGQSWEIDEPGFVFGDIFDNFLAGALDGSTLGFPEDISMALGWDFVLAIDEIASIDFVLSTVVPTSDFFLTHSDPDTVGGEYLYFSSTLNISSVSVPEPGTSLLLGVGLLALGFSRLRRPPTHAAV